MQVLETPNRDAAEHACAHDHACQAGKPLVSVVIATRNRPHALVSAVASVLANTVKHIEVVVVDQSDANATEQCLRAAYAHNARVRYYRDSGRGIAHGRNAGVAHAQADIIAITDDDCLVPPTWLADILDRFTRYPDVDLLYGRVDAPEHDYTQFVVPVSLLTEQRIERGLGRRSTRLEGIGANMALRRRLIEEIAGFDPWFGSGSPRWSAEDFELHYRALRRGRHVLLDPAITIEHLGLRPIEEAWALWRRDAQGDGALVAHMVVHGTPLAALRFWWWNVGRIGLRSLFNVLTLQFPAGLRLTAWMFAHSARGFWVEWHAPGTRDVSASHAVPGTRDRRTPARPLERDSRHLAEPAAVRERTI